MTRRPFRTRYINPSEEKHQRTYLQGTGLFAVRMAAGAVEVGLAITHGPTLDPVSGEALDRSWWWNYTLNGEVYAEPTIRQEDHKGFVRFDTGRPIDQAMYDYLLKHRKWARDHAPTRPEANPREAVDFNAAPPIY